MPKRTSIYRKLTPRQRSIAGFTQLWLTEDHLLLVSSSRFSEQYKRFMFGDIQAISVTALPDRIALQLVLAMTVAAWMLAAFAADSRFGKGFFVVTGALAAVAVIVDIARGQRCRCYLYTAVSRELLPPVSRMKRAQRFLATIQPLIEGMQGALPRDQAPEPTLTGWTFSETAAGEPPKIVEPPGYLPEILFGLFLLDAIVIGLGNRYPQAQLQSLLPSTMFCEIVLLVVAFFRRAGRDFRVVTYVIAGLAILGLGADVVNMVRSLGGWFAAVQEAAKQKRTVPPTLLFESIESGAMVIGLAWRAALGTIGLAVAFWERRKETR